MGKPVNEQDKLKAKIKKHQKEPGTLAEYYENMVFLQNRDERTAYQYYLMLRHLAKFLKHRRKGMDCLPEEVVMSSVSAAEMSALEESEWDDYLDYCCFTLQEADNTVAVRISAIRGYYIWLSESGFNIGAELLKCIKETKRPSLKQKKFRYITEETEKIICERLQGEYVVRNACIIHLLLRCGIGLNELCELTLEDLGLKEITVRNANGSVRTVPMDKVVQESMDKYISVRVPPTDGSNALFVSAAPKKGKLRRGAIEKMIRKAAKTAGPSFAGITIRDIRRTARSNLVNRYGENAALGLLGLQSKKYYLRHREGKSNWKKEITTDVPYKAEHSLEVER